MESAQIALRYKLVLGSFRVVDIKPIGDMFSITIELPNGIYANSNLPFKPKLVVGDLLQLYTEVYPDVKETNTSPAT